MIEVLLLLNPIYITLFWAIVLSLNKKQSNYPKNFLGKYMIIACLLYICYLIYYYPSIYHLSSVSSSSYFYYVDSFFQLFLFLLFPIYFIYIRLLTVDKKFSFRKHSKYLALPIIIFIIYSTANYSITKEEHYNFLYFDQEDLYTGNMLYFYIVYLSCRIIYVMQAISYLFLSHIHINRYKREISNYYANTAEASLNKVSIVNVILSITLIIYILITFTEKENFIGSSYWLLIPALLSALLLFTIGWLGNKQETVIMDNKIIDEDINVEVKINTTQYESIKLKIDQLFNVEKIYLNKDLSLWELSRLIGTNRTYISIVINKFYNQNFSTFVNTYRVKHVEQLILKNPKLTNMDLASLSGFGSVISMQRAIQSIGGTTIRELKACS